MLERHYNTGSINDAESLVVIRKVSRFFLAICFPSFRVRTTRYLSMSLTQTRRNKIEITLCFANCLPHEMLGTVMTNSHISCEASIMVVMTA